MPGSEVVIKFVGDTKQLKRAMQGMGVLVAGAAAAVFKFANEAGEAADRLLDLEQITGASTDKLQEMEHVARVAGTEQEFYANSVNEVVKAMDRIERGTGPAAEALEKLGIETRDANGAMRAAEAITDDAITALMGLEDASLRAGLAEDIFKRKAQELIPVLALGEQGIDSARQAAQELGLVQSGEALDAANEYRIKMEEVTARVKDLSFEIAEGAIPVIGWLIDRLEQAAEGAEQLGVMFQLEGRIDELKAAQERAKVVSDEYNQALREGYSDANAYRIAVEGITREALNAETAQKNFARAQGYVAEQTEAAEDAVKSLADEVRKATDPAFALRDAQEKFADASDKVNQLRATGETQSDAFVNALADEAEAQADLNYATEQFEQAGQTAVEGLFNLGEQAGQTREEIELLIGALEGLNNTPVNVDIQYNRALEFGGGFLGRDAARAIEAELSTLDRSRRRPGVGLR